MQFNQQKISYSTFSNVIRWIRLLWRLLFVIPWTNNNSLPKFQKLKGPVNCSTTFHVHAWLRENCIQCQLCDEYKYQHAYALWRYCVSRENERKNGTFTKAMPYVILAIRLLSTSASCYIHKLCWCFHRLIKFVAFTFSHSSPCSVHMNYFVDYFLWVIVLVVPNAYVNIYYSCYEPL